MKSKDIDLFCWLKQAVNNKELTTCKWEHDHRFKEVWITSRPRPGPGKFHGSWYGHPFHCKLCGHVKITDDWNAYKSIAYALERSRSDYEKPSLIIPCKTCFPKFGKEFWRRFNEILSL